jgi:stalled ribosome rescue protein Dom34
MPHAHACVWIDHREARIFSISEDDVDEIVLHEHGAPQHIHRRADSAHLGKAERDDIFLGEVGRALRPYRAIVLAGPGTARKELAGYLSEKQPQIAKRVWGIEPMDHPTDAQIVAAARKYFRAADRMHG